MGLLGIFSKNKVRVRFAPSPTGTPHLGNIRTALFAWLFARNQGGRFILRIEDTDQKRKEEGSVEKILESLDWLGLDIDEGVVGKKMEDGRWKMDQKGLKGPYFQSERLEIYQKHAQELLDKGQAFYCFCSVQRLKQAHEKQIAAGQAAKYNGACSRLSVAETKKRIAKGQARVIRLRIPENGETRYTDVIRGQISVKNELIDHQVLIKSDGFPTYHLAVVVDDHLMGITHVLRAEEWLPSTPKHILLYRYFGWRAPRFAHLPVVLGSDKSKLSKRHGAASVLEFREQGYLPGALVNYLAFLGWNPKTDQEILSRQELIKQFSLEKINKASPIFDITKLNWMNRQYIKNTPADVILSLSKDLIDKSRDVTTPLSAETSGHFAQNGEEMEKAIKLVQDRMETLKDFAGLTEFLRQDKLDYDAKILIPKKLDGSQTKDMLEKSLAVIKKVEAGDWQTEKLRQIFFKYIDENDLPKGDMLWPLRVAVTGLKNSPDVFGAIDALGKERSVERVKQAIDLL